MVSQADSEFVWDSAAAQRIMLVCEKALQHLLS